MKDRDEREEHEIETGGDRGLRERLGRGRCGERAEIMERKVV